MTTATLSPATQVETLLPLTSDETRRLKECERVIKQGLDTFYDVGNALAEVRESRLYRMEYGTFEDYCRGRWNMSRFYAHRLIDAAQVVDNLLPMGNIPANERQARELTKFEPDVLKAVWHIVVRSADTDDKGDPKVTESHIRAVKNVLTEVVKAGGMDDGSGEVKPLGQLITAAVTEEVYERLQRQKEYIKQHTETKEENERKAREKSDRSEVEMLQEPAIQEKLNRYLAMVTEFEDEEWPVELQYLRRMFQTHKAHANFQKTRNLVDDCEMILTVIKRMTADEDMEITIAAQELYDWLFDLGYGMSVKEYTSRLKYMSQDSVRMALLTDAGDGKQDDRRGALPGIVVYPWKKVWKLSKEEEDDEDVA